ncbi:MAG: cell division protein FtsB [Gammaproteobacteria bacterium 28-57-27]|nr:MAG: cell division protein FtsB [Gammaproteobacteria bacterium 28-57-27]
MKIVIIVLVLLFTALQYHLWFGEGSWPRAQAVREKFELQMSENEKLQQSNATMEAEVLDLKTGLDAIEERARAELGLVRQGDVYFQIIQPDKPKATPELSQDQGEDIPSTPKNHGADPSD